VLSVVARQRTLLKTQRFKTLLTNKKTCPSGGYHFAGEGQILNIVNIVNILIKIPPIQVIFNIYFAQSASPLFISLHILYVCVMNKVLES